MVVHCHHPWRHRHSVVARFVVILSVVCVLLWSGDTPAQAKRATAAPPPVCSDVTLHVALRVGEPRKYEVAGTLCAPAHSRSPVVLVLVHGSTYARYYWNFPFESTKYSFVRFMAHAGYPTFNYDRIGDGASSHPPSRLLDVYSDAFVLHEVISALRSGQIGGRSFTKVVTVGHSLGAAIQIYEAKTYPRDVNGVLATGISYDESTNGDNIAAAHAYPANRDPKFIGRGLDDGYVTTKPGTRGEVYYWLHNADPRVLAVDEALKQTRGSQELPTAYGQLYPPYNDTLGVNVPVFLVNGRYDIFDCQSYVNGQQGSNCGTSASLLAEEAPHWSPDACLHVGVVMNAGHDINLQRNAAEWFQAAQGWLDEFVGPDGTAHPSSSACAHGTAVPIGPQYVPEARVLVPPQIPGTAGLDSDIVFGDASRHRVYLSDAANAQVDAWDTRSGLFLGAMSGGFTGELGFPGSFDQQGPDGTLVDGLGQLWAGNGDGSVRVGRASPPFTETDSVVTGSSMRADELAYDATDRIVIATNPAQADPYVTLIDAVPDAAGHHHVLGHVAIPGAGVDSVEQPTWDPSSGTFLVAVRQASTAPNGEVAVIDPKPGEMHLERTFVVTRSNCHPAGSALGPDNELLLGCDSTAPLIMNARTGVIEASFDGTGACCADEVWYNRDDGRYYAAEYGNATLPPQVMVINAARRQLVINIPITDTSGAFHAVTAVGDQIFVPEVDGVHVFRELVGRGGP